MNDERNEPEAVPIDPEAERRELEGAGWKRIEDRMGKVVWRHPTSGYLYPQGPAMGRLRGDLASEATRGENEEEGVSEPLGLALRRIRQARGLTVEELASESGVDARTIREAEERGRTPRMDTIARLAKPLGLTFAEAWSLQRSRE